MSVPGLLDIIRPELASDMPLPQKASLAVAIMRPEGRGRLSWLLRRPGNPQMTPQCTSYRANLPGKLQ